MRSTNPPHIIQRSFNIIIKKKKNNISIIFQLLFSVAAISVAFFPPKLYIRTLSVIWRRKKGRVMFIKRLTIGLSGLAIAGILIVGCEKMNGPEPFLSTHQNQLILMVKSAEGGEVPTPLPLETLKKLEISDWGMVVYIGTPEDESGLPMDPVPHEMIGKIIFQ